MYLKIAIFVVFGYLLLLIQSPVNAKLHTSDVTVNPQTLASCKVTRASDSGSGTLRQCLLDLVADTTIEFDQNRFPPTNPTSIRVTSSLPAITVNDVIIDGSNAGIILDGSQLQRGDGLILDGVQDVMVRGIGIRNFPQAGLVILGGAKNNVIGGSRSTGSAPLGEGNEISNNGEGGMIIQDSGTTGNLVLGNDVIRNTGAGIRIRRFASQNTIGTGNVISGNGGAGIWISDSNPSDPLEITAENRVAGNIVGLDATGTISNTFGNGGSGILISDGASKNIIGGQSPTDRNVVSNNAFVGIAIIDQNSDQNQVRGNLIGTDVTGEKAFRNSTGIIIRNGAQQNTIGGVTEGERNIISGNGTGMFIWDPGTDKNKVIGNFIGTNISGTKAIPNGDDGINIGNGAQNNIVGGTSASERNLISGNGDDGLLLQDEDTDDNQIIGNFIGTDITGRVVLSNTNNGILIIDGPSRTLVGGEIAGAGNVISGNGYQGILIRDPGTTETKVLGNIIGLDETGMGKLGNSNNGIFIFSGANNNLIGGERQGARNVISGNGFNGISIIDSGTDNNLIQGNFIGTNITGQSAQGNTTNGVLIGEKASNNVIGGETLATRNIVSGNGHNGIIIQNAETTGNQVNGNYIGTDVNGERAVGNVNIGVILVDGPKETEIKRNLISGNGSEGIFLRDVGTTNNRITSNLIGTDASGESVLGNVWSGIALILSTNNNVIGGVDEGNIISGNGAPNTNSTGAGILLISSNANEIVGNHIGTDVNGLSPLGNKHDGITLVGQSSDNIIGGIDAGNVIGSNGDSGIWLEGSDVRENSVIGNHIGIDANGAGPLPNTNFGVYLGGGAISNTIGVSNTIAYNIAAGVAISGSATLGNEITRNSIHSNQGGEIVWITPTGQSQPPKLIDYSSPDHMLSGEACANCRVEIYANPSDQSAGTLFATASVANEGGAFTVAVEVPSSFSYLSALQIRPDGTTSEFSDSLRVITTSNIYLPLIANNANGQTLLNANSGLMDGSTLSRGMMSVNSKAENLDILIGAKEHNANPLPPQQK